MNRSIIGNDEQNNDVRDRVEAEFRRLGADFRESELLAVFIQRKKGISETEAEQHAAAIHGLVNSALKMKDLEITLEKPGSAKKLLIDKEYQFACRVWFSFIKLYVSELMEDDATNRSSFEKINQLMMLNVATIQVANKSDFVENFQRIIRGTSELNQEAIELNQEARSHFKTARVAALPLVVLSAVFLVDVLLLGGVLAASTLALVTLSIALSLAAGIVAGSIIAGSLFMLSSFSAEDHADKSISSQMDPDCALFGEDKICSSEKDSAAQRTNGFFDGSSPRGVVVQQGVTEKDAAEQHKYSRKR
jgi:hypothetical protein